jgi:hypothetical protein
VWHALLSLFRSSPRLRVIRSLTAPHPLTAMALQYLPGLQSFSRRWGLPFSFEIMLHTPGSKTSHYATVGRSSPWRRHDWHLSVLEQDTRETMERSCCTFVEAERREGTSAPAAAATDGRALFFYAAAH